MNLLILLFFLFFSLAVLANQNVECLPNGGRLTGGQDARPGQFPFMAVMRRVSQDHLIGHCTATIIDAHHILTTAACVKPYNDPDMEHLMKVAVGTNIWGSGGTLYSIAKYIVHERYISNSDDVIGVNDIAVLRVVGNITFSATVQPVKLLYKPLPVNPPNNTAPFPPPFPVEVVGFDYTELAFLHQNITSYSECDRVFKAKGTYYRVWEYDQYCTYRPGHGLCFWDRGGPLLYNGQQIGITSFTTCYPFNKGEYPDVYTNLLNYQKWIENALKK